MSSTSTNIRPRRSFIFTPGLRPDMFPKALASGADIVCVELEDGIAPKDKAEARDKALALFAEPQADDGVERIVRINSMRERFGIEDVNAILASDTPPPALMMPKVRAPDEVITLDQLLSEAGHDTRLHVIIETNEGLEAAYDIAGCSSRIDAIFFGGVDMAAELRCQLAWEPLLYARADFLRSDDGNLLLNELELIEPSLFFRHGPGAGHRFACALQQHLLACG